MGVELGIIKKSGAWFSYNGERLGQGRDNAKLFIKEHEDIRAEIEEKIREHSQEVGMVVEVQDDDDEMLDDDKLLEMELDDEFVDDEL